MDVVVPPLPEPAEPLPAPVLEGVELVVPAPPSPAAPPPALVVVLEAELGVEVTLEAPEALFELEPEPEVALDELAVLVVELRVATDGLAVPVVGTVSVGAPAALSAAVLLDPHPASPTADEITASATNDFAANWRVI